MSIDPMMGELPPVAECVRAYARKEGLWRIGDAVLAAVSGGPDSMALLDVLSLIGTEWQLTLVVGHVHHGLRPEADADADYVKEVAARYNLRYLIRRVDVRGRVAKTGESMEEAARELRYAALQEMAQDVGTQRIATGHTADDQAETVMMRILRGTGVAGLAGIPPQRGRIIRPLLSVWRQELLAYLHERKVGFCTDLTNESLDMTRNRIRLELLPMLEREYAPRLRARLQNLAEIARQDGVLLEGMAETEFTRLRQWMPDGLALSPAPDLPHAIRRRMWRLAIAEVRGGLEDISFEHLQDIENLPPGGEVHLPGLRVIHESNRLVFMKGTQTLPVTIPELTLTVPGRLCYAPAGCCLTTEVSPTPFPIESGDVAVLDAGSVKGRLVMRSWLPGDRFRPLGAPGERKLQDIFVDAGVPRRLRSRIPIILDEEGIIWLAGFRIADRVKMELTTTRSMRFSIEWQLNPWTLKPSDAV
ncbi:MAG: tRNA lysidine(34) synthetase TilS [Armatimonadota bacterium]